MNGFEHSDDLRRKLLELLSDSRGTGVLSEARKIVDEVVRDAIREHATPVDPSLVFSEVVDCLAQGRPALDRELYAHLAASSVVERLTAGSASGGITRLYRKWQLGPGYTNELFDRMYPDLYRDADKVLYRETRLRAAGLSPMVLVNELFVKLQKSRTESQTSRVHRLVTNKAHIHNGARKLMQYIKVDYAKHLCRRRRGGGIPPESITVYEQSIGVPPEITTKKLALQNALQKLEAIDPRQSFVIRRDLEGWEPNEIAAQLGVSVWKFKRIKAEAQKNIKKALGQT